jgi:16S rRNA (adenine1518-N6/adenine1519-N6)-dimethyltransferase
VTVDGAAAPPPRLASVATSPAARAHRPRRRFSQNFLIDRGVADKLVAAIDPRPGDRLVEIGPGEGALTEPLLERVGAIDAVEIDRDLAAALGARFPPERLRVHVGDALRFDFCALGSQLRVVGNLPYHICSPLLFRLAEAVACLRDCHFMLQREVVERIVAAPGSKRYGRLSVMLQYRFAVQRLLRVPARAFRPVPKVESAFVRLVPHRPLPVRAADERIFASVVAKAFGQRRKTLRNALRGVIDADELAALGIDPALRAERLPVEAFVRIADRVRASRPSGAE